MASNCACRGIRFCANCKNSDRVKKMRSDETYNERFSGYSSYVFNSKDGKCYLSSGITVISTLEDIRNRTVEVESMEDETLKDLESFDVKGLILMRDFLSEKEENQLVEDIEKTPWVESQSGRRKQVSLINFPKHSDHSFLGLWTKS